MKQWRLRLKENPKKYAKYLEQQKKYLLTFYGSIEKLREYNRIKKKESRERKMHKEESLKK
jgi:hypothetical protein